MRYLIVLALDAMLGDPRKLLHPVQMIGYMVEKIECFLRNHFEKTSLKFKGFVLVLAVGSISYMIPLFMMKIDGINIYLWYYFAWTGIGVKSLYQHAESVYSSLSVSTENAREKLGMIVSRETDALDREAIIRGTIETVAENASDGIIGPLFYLAIGGVPLMMLYKAVNTMDAMVGYKSEKYIDFGCFAAKTDDLLNLIPARITAILIIVSAAFLQFDYKNAYKTVIRDAKKHASPNAGYPEAAVAGALNIALCGPSVYHGKIYDKLWLGDSSNEIKLEDIKATEKMMLILSIIAVVSMIVIEVVL
ncbi:MAG: adenosylcobinamide-phosphate synthase CbiB [Bacillota bacterium]|nr:adenosylcobinamide-phosphate synthase CbiB [Bacillota bacterium]